MNKLTKLTILRLSNWTSSVFLHFQNFQRCKFKWQLLSEMATTIKRKTALCPKKENISSSADFTQQSFIKVKS